MDERILINFIIHTLITSNSMVCIKMFSLANTHVKVITWYTQTAARQLLLSAPPLRLCIIHYNKTGNVRRTEHWGAFVQPLSWWKSDKYYIFWVCRCNLVYPARKVHAPYCHLWPTRLYNIFPRYLINGTIFGKKVIEYKMCVLIFSTNFAWNISYSKKIWARYGQKFIVVFMWNTRYSCQILIKL
jgi:hypothetical protein